MAQQLMGCRAVFLTASVPHSGKEFHVSRGGYGSSPRIGISNLDLVNYITKCPIRVTFGCVGLLLFVSPGFIFCRGQLISQDYKLWRNNIRQRLYLLQSSHANVWNESKMLRSSCREGVLYPTYALSVFGSRLLP